MKKIEYIYEFIAMSSNSSPTLKNCIEKSNSIRELELLLMVSDDPLERKRLKLDLLCSMHEFNKCLDKLKKNKVLPTPVSER